MATTGNASELIAVYLREQILSGRFKPGDRVRQEEIALANGTSRVPVREALRMLESEGLIQLVPHSGARVSRLDYAEFSEVYRMREVIEPLLMDASVPLLSDSQIAQLEELATSIEAASNDVNTWLDLDRQFHLGAYVAAAMPRAFRIVRDFWNRTQQYRRQFVASLEPGALDATHLEHRLIVDAIKRRDGEDAAERLSLHIRRTRVGLADRPDLFET